MQKITDPGFRVDRGPVQFGNDWPGTFFRGDHSGSHSDWLRRIASGLEQADHDNMVPNVFPAYAKYLRELADEFSACQIKGGWDGKEAEADQA